MIEHSDLDTAAKRILLDGQLLETTEAIGLKLSHNHDWTRRMIEEISLILAGQTVKSLNVGIVERAFSHAGFYGAHGFGRDFTWSIATKSGIFPIDDAIRVTRLDNITDAALTGTITESEIVPPLTITHDVIFVGEYSTFMRGSNADTLAANIRSLTETGEYHRRLAKVVGLKAIIDDPENKDRQRLMDDIARFGKMGMHIDADTGEIHVETTSSWIISSARFGSELTYGKPLLGLGDIDRYRWRSYLPTREERIKVTSEVGSLPPIDTNSTHLESVNGAWRTLFNTMKRITTNNAIRLPQDEASYQIRKKMWDDTQKEMFEKYPDMKPVYEDQLVNLRATAEFRRLVYQHATLKQFERDQGYDLAEPGKFVIDDRSIPKFVSGSKMSV